MTARWTPNVAGSLAAAGVLLYALAMLLSWPDRINHDAAMYLYMGERLLDGAVPYVDIIDLNPPLIIYLSAIPAAVARLLGTPVGATMLVMTWLFTAWSIDTSRRVLRRAVPESSVAGVFAVIFAVFTVWLIERNDFGQKEHLFAMALVPFVILRASRASHDTPVASWTAVLVGVMAGTLASLKPHFVVIALVPELYWLARRRGLRELRSPELLGFVAAGLIYAVHFLLIPQEMRAVFFDRWVPFIADGYHAYDQPMALILRRWVVWLPMAVTLAVAVGWRRIPGARVFGPTLLLAIPMAVAMMVFQQKGWTHHALPAFALICLALALMAAAIVDWSARWGRGVLLAGTVVAVGAITLPPDVKAHDDALARAVETHSAPGEAVLILSTSVDPTFPMLLDLHRRQASRYMFAFPLPMIYSRAAWNKAAADDELRFRAELEEDIRAHQPKMIAVADWCMACPAGFTLAGYLQDNGVLTGAMARYREIPPVDGLRVFVLSAPASEP